MNSKLPPVEVATLEKGIDLQRLPAHVAIIMDGNGRWAKQRLLNRVHGHERGAETVRTIVTVSREIGIPTLTLYAFSTENWQRSAIEVSALMSLLKKFLESEKPIMMSNGIRLNAIGQIERLPQDVQDVLFQTIEATRHNPGMVLNLALSYGARAEIVRMTRILAEKARDGSLDPQSITEETVSSHLYTHNLPDPDLLIRTSGEMRISNFLLWQIAYSELHITRTLWPDFSRNEYLDILKDYQQRDRRFGNV
ncbi:MAG: isoprenyl transferase [Deltaproteobacteria bacterium]|nr:isoprenyl transferase [Deltaproteobacteria bacterium]